MSKIIDLPQEVLSELFIKYNYDNIQSYLFGPEKSLYYLVPQIFILGGQQSLDKYYWERNGEWYLSTQQMTRVLGITTKLTTQTYFDLLVLHINDTEDRPKCPQCGRELKWSGRITSGYGSQGHKWIGECITHCCSQSCSLQYRVSNLELYPDYKEFQESGGAFGMIHRNKDYYGNVGFGNKETHAKTMMNKFINAGDSNDVCYFYFAALNDQSKFKFGITQDYETRLAFGISFKDYEYIKLLYSGSRVDIAKFEYDIKSRLNWEEYQSNEKLLEFNELVSQLVKSGKYKLTEYID